MSIAKSYLHCNESTPGVSLATDIRNELSFAESVDAIAQFKDEVIKEALGMGKYKIEPLPGMPEWFQQGIVCKVRNNSGEAWSHPRQMLYFKPGNTYAFHDCNGSIWRFAEPVEAWEPQEGEWVVPYDDPRETIMIIKYQGKSGRMHVDSAGKGWDHAARLQYPDGRVIDCACSLKELLSKTEWI